MLGERTGTHLAGGACRVAQSITVGGPDRDDSRGHAGHYLLKLMHKDGAQLLASGPAMQALISEITG